MIRMTATYGAGCAARQLTYVTAMASQEIEGLTQALARLPGLGPRSARRAVLHLMKKREGALEPLLLALQQGPDTPPPVSDKEGRRR